MFISFHEGLIKTEIGPDTKIIHTQLQGLQLRYVQLNCRQFVLLMCQRSMSMQRPSASKSAVLSAEFAVLSVCSFILKASEFVSKGGPFVC
jgi:hypothetical protein